MDRWGDDDRAHTRDGDYGSYRAGTRLYKSCCKVCTPRHLTPAPGRLGPPRDGDDSPAEGPLHFQIQAPVPDIYRADNSSGSFLQEFHLHVPQRIQNQRMVIEVGGLDEFNLRMPLGDKIGVIIDSLNEDSGEQKIGKNHDPFET